MQSVTQQYKTERNTHRKSNLEYFEMKIKKNIGFESKTSTNIGNGCERTYPRGGWRDLR